MENYQLFELAYDALKDWGYILVPIVILVVSPRARILVLHYIWNKVFNKDFSLDDKELNGYVQRQLDLDKAKIAFHGFNIQSIDHAKALNRWCEQYNIAMSDASKFSSSMSYNKKDNQIVFEEPKFVRVGKCCYWVQLCLISLLTLFIFIIPYFSGLLGFSSIKTRDTGHYLYITSSQTVSGFFVGSDQFRLDVDCVESVNPNQFLSNREHSSLCKLIKTKESVDTYIADSTNKSMIFLLILFPPVLLLLKFSKTVLMDFYEKIRIYNLTQQPNLSNFHI